MYNLPYYKEKDKALLFEFMKKYPFAMLMGVDHEQKPVATQIPFLFVEKEGTICLRGHIMRGTDQHKAFSENKNVMALFTGPHTYVSASWYEDKQQGSTWNYMTVQTKGELSFLPEDQLLILLNDLTSHFENDPSSLALFKNIPEEYINRMVKAIVAVEIKVVSIEHVFKLSQNRDEKSYFTIIEKLMSKDADAQAIAGEMIKRKQELFPI